MAFQIHAWDDGVPIEETLTALNDLVTCGKVRYVGASNVTGWQLQKIVDLCQLRGWNKWISLQVRFKKQHRAYLVPSWGNLVVEHLMG